MTVKGSDRDPAKTCNTDGCDAWATEQSDRTRCRHCGGESTGPKTEEGKKKTRMNGMRHGLRADPANVLEKLREEDEHAYAWVQDKFESYLDAAPFGRDSAHADQLLQICVREYTIWNASGIQIDKGVITKQKKAAGDQIFMVDVDNPANKALDRMERTVVKRLDKLGVMPSPEKQMAENASDMGEKVARILQGDGES